MGAAAEAGSFPDDFEYDSETRREERLRLQDWSKECFNMCEMTSARSFISDTHMRLEALVCEVGLHFLYDWSGEYTPEKRSQIIRQHMDKYPERLTQVREDGPMELTDEDFLTTVLSDLSALPELTHNIVSGEESISTTYEQFENALPKNGLENKFLEISNISDSWIFSSKNDSVRRDQGRTGTTSPYTLHDKLEYRVINTLLDDVDEYKWEAEWDPEEESYEEESEDESEEESIGEEERKEMCSKGLEILESIMEKDDQRMGEGDFVNLCNLLKELHKS